MRQFAIILLVAIFLLASTIATGFVQGRLTNRWGLRPDTQQAAERLNSPLPATAGNWKVIKEDRFSPEVVETLHCPAHIYRVYQHQQTGDTVTIAVIVGPPGPVSVHTPEVCYSSWEYSITGARVKTPVEASSGQKHVLWELALKSNDLHGAPLRVFYGWTTGSTWEAAEHPRFGYGGLPHLYKLQMSVTSQPASQATKFDPAKDFLSHFLPELQPLLVSASRHSGSSR